MTSPERKALEAQFAIGLESAAALAAQGKPVCQVINEIRDDGIMTVRMHPEFHGRLPWGTELYISAAPQPAQQPQLLTDAEVTECRTHNMLRMSDSVLNEFSRVIEQAVLKKNGFAPQPAQQPAPRYEPTDEGIGND